MNVFVILLITYYNAAMKKTELRLNSVTYKVGRNSILDNISFELSGSQAVCLLGPNGAGKSTLLKIISAHLLSETGTVSLNQLSPLANRRTYLSQIGYMPEQAYIEPFLTVEEQLKLHAKVMKVDDIEARIDKVMESCHLSEVMNKRTGRLSLGYKQRLNLAQALLREPEVIIMDEPLNGLDPHLIIEFREMIQALKKKSMVLFSTHYLAEAQQVSDKVMIIQHGEIHEIIDLKTGAPQNLEHLYMQHTQHRSVVL